MITTLPITWFILLFLWSVFILRKRKNYRIIISLLLGFLLEIYSVIAMNKAIDIVDFSLKDSFGFDFWFYSSILSFIFGVIIFIYLQFKKDNN